MFNNALTSNPNGNNSRLGVHYCGRFYPATQDKATGKFVVYINGMRQEYTFLELLRLQQAEQDRAEAWERVDKGFEEQKASSNYWMGVYEKAKEKALYALNKIYTPMKEEAAKKAYEEEKAYSIAKDRYDRMIAKTPSKKVSDLTVSQRVHAEEYYEQMTTAKNNKDEQDGIRSFARMKEISAESQYLYACHSAFNEALHGGEIAMQQKAAKHIANMC